MSRKKLKIKTQKGGIAYDCLNKKAGEKKAVQLSLD